MNSFRGSMIPVSIISVLLAGWGAALPALADDACDGFKWDVSKERVLFAAAPAAAIAGRDSKSAPTVVPNRLYQLRLAPQDQVTLAASAAKRAPAAPAFAGVATFKVPRDGQLPHLRRRAPLDRRAVERHAAAAQGFPGPARLQCAAEDRGVRTARGRALGVAIEQFGPGRRALDDHGVARAETLKPTLRFRVDFGNRCSVGIGKIELLEGIERTGSLSQAAREMRMSYRRAWLLLEDMNSSFEQSVAKASVGGRGGGGVVLTAFGRSLAAGYRQLESRLQPLGAAYAEKFAGQVKAVRGKRIVKSASLRLKAPGRGRRSAASGGG